jgi:hypothetical protein
MKIASRTSRGKIATWILAILTNVFRGYPQSLQAIVEMLQSSEKGT